MSAPVSFSTPQEAHREMVAAGSRRAKGSRLIIDVETSMIAAEAMGNVETLPYRWVTEKAF